MTKQPENIQNPHFDLNLIRWDDAYSGQFPAPPGSYQEQFELQWKLSLIDKRYGVAPGAAVDDAYVNDRIYEWTGVHPDGVNGFHDPTGGVRKLDYPVPGEAISGKRCIDIGCGVGRWTRAMQKLGASEVVSIDASASALESTRRFNPNTLRANVMALAKEHPEWQSAFDFANFWGVAMCTNDPLAAFLNAASTVNATGMMFLMVYAPGGLHEQPLTNIQRKKFNSLRTAEDRLAYVEHVFHRKWDWSYPLSVNLEHMYCNLRGFHKGTRVGVLDMLEPFYNWVIPLSVIEGWKEKAKFRKMTVLNEHEQDKCAYHVLLER